MFQTLLSRQVCTRKTVVTGACHQRLSPAHLIFGPASSRSFPSFTFRSTHHVCHLRRRNSCQFVCWFRQHHLPDRAQALEAWFPVQRDRCWCVVLVVLRFVERIELRRTRVCHSGQTGLGKSTLINTIFASHLIDSKGRLASDEPVRQTTEIHPVSHGAWFIFIPARARVQCRLVIVENGVRLRLNIVDTPGYGDQINNEGW